MSSPAASPGSSPPPTSTRKRHKFPTQYELLAEVPISLSVDLRKLTASGRTDARQLAALSSFTYDAKLERTIMERWEGRVRPTTAGSSNGEGGEGRRRMDEEHIRTITDALESVSLRGTRAKANEEGSKAVLDKTFPAQTSTTKDSSSSPTDVPAPKTPQSPPSYPQTTSSVPRPVTSPSFANFTGSAASANEVANLYLPDETDERREHFARVWRETRSLGPLPPTDIEVLRAFFTFEGDADKAISHLRPYMALKELGFPEEDICTTLLLYNNNQEEALEHLIRGGPK